MHLLNLPLSPDTRSCASAPSVENTTTLHGHCFQHGGTLSVCRSFVTPERRHVHLLNLLSSAGTWEASRGRVHRSFRLRLGAPQVLSFHRFLLLHMYYSQA